MQILGASICSIQLYGAETWLTTPVFQHRPDNLKSKWHWRIKRTICMDLISNDRLRNETSRSILSNKVAQWTLHWSRLLLRLPVNTPSIILSKFQPINSGQKHQRGWPILQWKESLGKLMDQAGISLHDAWAHAADCFFWGSLITLSRLPHHMD